MYVCVCIYIYMSIASYTSWAGRLRCHWTARGLCIRDTVEAHNIKSLRIKLRPRCDPS